jgi:hypothetical protein
VKLKALVGMAGGMTLKPGDVFDAPGDEAKRLIAAGYAVPEADDQTERAVATAAPETRPARKARK